MRAGADRIRGARGRGVNAASGARGPVPLVGAMGAVGDAGDIAEAAARIRDAVSTPISPRRIAASLKAALALWRERGFERRRATVTAIAERTAFSPKLIDSSLDALLAPFTDDALDALVPALSRRAELIGFVLAGNVAGAGLHEVLIALACGAGVLIKSAAAEPVFFSNFVSTLQDPQVAARVAVFGWSRARRDLTLALRNYSDILVVYGDDSTIAALAEPGKALIGFGSRISGAAIAASVREFGETAEAIARDVSLFEQLGCLSPHHVFVEDSDGDRARRFASDLAAALDRALSGLPGPRELPLDDGAAIRRARETARWHAIAGERVRLLEGAQFAWTVILDENSGFRVSPGFRTVYVSPFRDLSHLRSLLAPAESKLEAFALVGSPEECARLGTMLRWLGASYLAAPGQMQSPPLTWRHGGGAFLDLFGIV